MLLFYDKLLTSVQVMRIIFHPLNDDIASDISDKYFLINAWYQILARALACFDKLTPKTVQEPEHKAGSWFKWKTGLSSAIRDPQLGLGVALKTIPKVSPNRWVGHLFILVLSVSSAVAGSILCLARAPCLFFSCVFHSASGLILVLYVGSSITTTTTTTQIMSWEAEKLLLIYKCVSRHTRMSVGHRHVFLRKMSI